MSEPTDMVLLYESGLSQLLSRLEHKSENYVEALIYQQRLYENPVEYQRYGDTERCRSDRAKIIEQLNKLASMALSVSFNQLCQIQGSAEGLRLPSITYIQYLERLETQIVKAFDQSRYVLLTVEAPEAQDTNVLTARRHAFQATFARQVEIGRLGGRQPSSMAADCADLGEEDRQEYGYTLVCAVGNHCFLDTLFSL